MTIVADDKPKRFFSRPTLTGNNLLVAGLLLLTLAFGAHFRLWGQNWDDFSHLHPDERFLTVNLLPAVGGGLEFTPSEKRFPAQKVLVNINESRYTTYRDIQLDTDSRVGYLHDSFGEEAVVWFLNGAGGRGYRSLEDAVLALNTGEIDALLLDNSLPVDPANPLFSSTFVLSTIPSVEMQQIHCLYRNPQSQGIGGFFDTDCSPLNPNKCRAGFLYLWDVAPVHGAFHE